MQENNSAHGIATVSSVKNNPFSRLRGKLLDVNLGHYTSMLTFYEFIQVGTFKLEKTTNARVISSVPGRISSATR